MNQRIKLIKAVLILIVCSVIAILPTGHVQASSISNLVTFDNTTDLDTYFNSDSSPQFTNVDAEGIANTGAINVPVGTDDIWTTKQGYSVAGAGDKYTFSAYFKIKENAGYGGLGFSKSDTNTTDYFGSPEMGVGVYFHGGGGAFVNNRSDTILDWYETTGDLVLGNWYKMIFKVTAKGNNTYDLNLQIWNSDENGVLGTLFTEQSLADVVNADLGGASTIHGYFSAAGWRMEKIDNFLINLEGGATFVEAGLPVVLTAPVSDITIASFETGGNVTDEQGAEVTYKGVCWSTSTSPNINDNDCTNYGTGLGTYSVGISNLIPGTTYYVRSYATNSEGTSYGSEMTVSTATIPTPTPTHSATSTPKPTKRYYTSADVAASPTPTVTPEITVELTPSVTPTITTVPRANIIQLLILDAEGQPFKNTSIVVENKTYSTDENGKVKIESLNIGNHSVSLKIADKTYSKEFVLGENTTDVITVQIDKQKSSWIMYFLWLLLLLLIVMTARKITKNARNNTNN